MSREMSTINERTGEIRGIKKLQEILLPDGSQRRRTALFDLDDTIKESLKVPWNDGTSRRYFPQTAEALQLVHESGACLGVVTEQTFIDIDPFLSELAAFAGKEAAYAYFNGIVIGEGGTVVLKRATDGIPTPRTVFTGPFQEERAKMLAWFDTNLSFHSEPFHNQMKRFLHLQMNP